MNYKTMSYKTSVIRRERFNAAHRLHNPDWSDEENTRVFGKCNNPSYHGHNYTLDVQLTGEVNPLTGYVMDLKLLSDIVTEEVIDRYDHRNLNLDVPEFKELNPTAENIARIIYERLIIKLPPELELQIRLLETENNSVVYPAK